MPQVSLYIDQELYMEIKIIAKKKSTSISRVVNGMIKENIDNSWPEGYFDLIGSLKDDEDPLILPERLPQSMNASRKTL